MANNTGHGGRRPGAGRKPGKSPERAEYLRQLRSRVYEEFDALMTAQLEAAKGLFHFLVQSDNGWVRVTDEAAIDAALAAGAPFYRIVKKDPDMRALKDAWDRAIGVPKQEMEIALPEPVRITHIFSVQRCQNCGHETAPRHAASTGVNRAK
jgi:hypothetical protein